MTLTQQMRLMGAEEQLAHRGVPVELPRSGVRCRAIMQAVGDDATQYLAGENARALTRVGVLRRDMAGSDVLPGESIVGVDTGATYRVTDIEDRPDDIFVRFICEAA